MESNKWRLNQLIGGDAGDETNEEDFISTLSFDHSGQHLAVGDNLGRVIIFESQEDPEKGIQYKFKTEFHAHSESFDVLRSEHIPPKVIDLKWLKSTGPSLMLLSTTEKAINLCKIKEENKKIFKPVNLDVNNPDQLSMPISSREAEPTWNHIIQKTYPKLHKYPIHSLSVSVNESNFLSSDEFSVFLWDINKPLHAFPIYELQHLQDDVEEMVTSAEFSPQQESVFLSTTNKGARLGDLRKSCSSKKSYVRFEEAFSGKRNIFTDYLEFVSSGSFLGDNKIVTRELLQSKIWDIRQPNRPLKVVPLNEKLKTRLADMYENDAIMERFNAVASPGGHFISTGMFNKAVHIIDTQTHENLELSLDYSGKVRSRSVPPDGSGCQVPAESYNFDHKTTKVAWNPVQNTFATAVESSIFVCSQT